MTAVAMTCVVMDQWKRGCDVPEVVQWGTDRLTVRPGAFPDSRWRSYDDYRAEMTADAGANEGSAP